MGVEEIVNLFVNNGVAVAVIGYFALRDWKFMGQLTATLAVIEKFLEKEIKEKEIKEEKEK